MVPCFRSEPDTGTPLSASLRMATICVSLNTGGMRRTHLRGHANILKRHFVHIGGFNLGLLMRRLVGSACPAGSEGD